MEIVFNLGSVYDAEGHIFIHAAEAVFIVSTPLGYRQEEGISFYRRTVNGPLYSIKSPFFKNIGRPGHDNSLICFLQLPEQFCRWRQLVPPYPQAGGP